MLAFHLKRPDKTAESDSSLPSRLPRPEQVLQQGDTLVDHILSLLAGAALSDGLLSYTSYIGVQGALQTLFDVQALDPEIQTKLHHALLNPPSNLPDLAKTVARQLLQGKKEEKASCIPFGDAFPARLLQSLDELCPKNENTSAMLKILAAGLGDGSDTSTVQNKLSWATSLPRLVGNGMDNLRQQADDILNTSRKSVAALFNPYTTRFNGNMDIWLGKLEQLAFTLNDAELNEKIRNLRKNICPQPFKIAVAGERKRGKSSLINAIVGQEISPVRESVPETAVVVTFHYNRKEQYSVTCLNEEQYCQLQTCLQQGNDMARSRRLQQQWENGTFVPGQQIRDIDRADLQAFIAAGSERSDLIARADIGLPLEILGHDVMLIDTPGLNDTDEFRNYLSCEECLGADCLLFVMHANNAGSKSELDLLRYLIRSGRAVTLIGIITHGDRLNDVKSLQPALEQAQTMLQKACLGAEHIRIAGILAINAREAMEKRCRESSLLPQNSKEFDRLLDLLLQIMKTDRNKSDYRKKITTNCLALIDFTREHLNRALSRNRPAPPDKNILGMLENISGQFLQVSQLSHQNALSIVQSLEMDMKELQAGTEASLQHFHDRLVLKLMDAINKKMESLGSDYNNEDRWKDFFSTDCAQIEQQIILELKEELDASHTAMEEKLRLFADRTRDFTQKSRSQLILPANTLTECLASLPAGLDGRRYLIALKDTLLEHTKLGGGIAAGLATSIRPITILAPAIALAAGNIMATTAIALASYIFYKLLSQKTLKKHRLNLYEKTIREEAEKLLQQYRQEQARQNDDIRERQEAIVQELIDSLHNLYMPAHQLHLFIRVMRKVHNDASRFELNAMTTLQNLSDEIQAYRKDCLEA